MELSRVRIGGISRQAQRLVGFQDQVLVGLGEFSNSEVGSGLLPTVKFAISLSRFGLGKGQLLALLIGCGVILLQHLCLKQRPVL